MSFYDLWKKSDRSYKLLTENHTYQVGTDETPVFARFDEYMAAEPHREPVFEGPLPEFLGYDDEGDVLSANAMPELTKRPKRGGAAVARSPRQRDDEWQVWQRAKCKHLLGEARVARTGRGYTVYPQDEAVNKAILGAANKVIPSRINPETGLPCEEFRDLCNHLVADGRGLHTFADGTVSTFYLEKTAIAYVKKLGTATSATRYKLEATNKGH